MSISWGDILQEVAAEIAAPKTFEYEKLRSDFIKLDRLPTPLFFEYLNNIKPYYFLEHKKDVKHLILVLVSKVENKEVLVKSIITKHKPNPIDYIVLSNLLIFVGPTLSPEYLEFIQWKYVGIFRDKALLSAGNLMCKCYPTLVNNENFLKLCKKVMFEVSQEGVEESLFCYNIKTFFIPMAAELNGLETLSEVLLRVKFNNANIKSSILLEVLKVKCKRDPSCIPRTFEGFNENHFDVLFEILSNVSCKTYEYSQSQIVCILTFLEENDLELLKIHFKYFLSHLCVQIFRKNNGLNYFTFIKAMLIHSLKRYKYNLSPRTALFIYRTVMDCLNNSLHTKYTLQGNEKLAGTFVKNKLAENNIKFGTSSDIKQMLRSIKTEDLDEFFQLLFVIEDDAIKELDLDKMFFFYIHDSTDIFVDGNVELCVQIFLEKACFNLNDRILFLNRLAECCLLHVELYLKKFSTKRTGPIACIKALSSAISIVGLQNVYPQYLTRINEVIGNGIPLLTTYLNNQDNRSLFLAKLCEKVTNQLAQLMLIVMEGMRNIDIDEVERILKLGEQLLTCNMRFTVAKCSEYFTKMVLFIGNKNFPFLKDYYKSKLNTMTTFVADTNVLRRSAELRTIMSAIGKGLRMEKKKEFLEEAISVFMTVPSASEEELFVTKLNCLDEFFMESSFRTYLSKFMPQALVISVYATSLENFKIRNGGSLLLRTLINKLAPNACADYNIGILDVITISKSFFMLVQKVDADNSCKMVLYKLNTFKMLMKLNQDYYRQEDLFHKYIGTRSSTEENSYWFVLFTGSIIKENLLQVSPFQFYQNNLFREIKRFRLVFGYLRVLTKWYKQRNLLDIIPRSWSRFLNEFSVDIDFINSEAMNSLKDVIVNQSNPVLFQILLNLFLGNASFNMYTKVLGLEDLISEDGMQEKPFFMAFYQEVCTFIFELPVEIMGTLSTYIIRGCRIHDLLITSKPTTSFPNWYKIENSTTYAALSSVIYYHADTTHLNLETMPRELIVKQFFHANEDILSEAFYSIRIFKPLETLVYAVYIICLTDHGKHPLILPNICDAFNLEANLNFGDFLDQIFSTHFFEAYFEVHTLDPLDFFPYFENSLFLFQIDNLNDEEGTVAMQCSSFTDKYPCFKLKLVNYYLRP